MMKKLLSMMLAFAMCLALAGCGAGEGDASSAVVLGPSEPQSPRSEEGLLAFDLAIANPTTDALSIQKMEIVRYIDGKPSGEPAVFTDAQLDYICPLSGSILPGDTYSTCIRCAAFDADEIEFTIHMSTGDGSPLLHRAVFDMAAPSPSDSPDDEQLAASSEILFPEIVGNDWRFPITLVNHTDSPLTLQKLEIFHNNNGVTAGDPSVFTSPDLPMSDLGTLAPGDEYTWSDGHPIVSDFNEMAYRFTFADPSGNAVAMEFVFDLSGSAGEPSAQLPAEYSGDHLTPVYSDRGWEFHIQLVNDTDVPLTLQQLEIFHYNNGVSIDEPTVFTSADLSRIKLGFGTLAPGDSYQWQDAHPIVDYFNEAEHRFTFSDPSGKEVVQSFRYKLSTDPSAQSQPTADYAADSGRDLETLRYDADFAIEVAPGVTWVPARALGESRYTNAQIYAMLSDSPEDKQAAISTLYEALQLYQVGGFSSSDDNVRSSENGFNWEHHKPGCDAVRTNTGCCATDSNWLNYILRNDYDEIGYIATSQRDGSGHIYNYLKQDGAYYFIDLTHYRTDWVATAVESGDLNDYYSSDFILGNIHKAGSVQAFVDYVQSAFGDPPGLMFQYTAENCLAITSVHSQGGVIITYEDAPGVHVNVIFDDASDALDHTFVTPPVLLPDWSKASSFPFPE